MKDFQVDELEHCFCDNCNSYVSFSIYDRSIVFSGPLREKISPLTIIACKDCDSVLLKMKTGEKVSYSIEQMFYVLYYNVEKILNFFRW